MLDEGGSRPVITSDFKPETVPWGAGSALSALAFTAFFYIVAGSLFAVLAASFYRHDKLDFTVASYQLLALGVVISAYWIIRRRYHAGFRSLGFRVPRIQVLVYALASVVPILIGVTVLAYIFTTFIPAYHLQGNAKETLPIGHQHVGYVKGTYLLAWAAVEVPLVEETLFRGIIFQGLYSYLRRRAGAHLSLFLAAVASGAVFGLAHFEPHTLPILIFLGIVLAYAFYYGKSIYASAVIHGAFNAVAAVSVFQHP